MTAQHCGKPWIECGRTVGTERSVHRGDPVPAPTVRPIPPAPLCLRWRGPPAPTPRVKRHDQRTCRGDSSSGGERSLRSHGAAAAAVVRRDTPGECAVPAELHVCHSSTVVENPVDNSVEKSSDGSSGAVSTVTSPRCAPRSGTGPPQEPTAVDDRLGDRPHPASVTAQCSAPPARRRSTEVPSAVRAMPASARAAVGESTTSADGTWTKPPRIPARPSSVASRCCRA